MLVMSPNTRTSNNGINYNADINHMAIYRPCQNATAMDQQSWVESKGPKMYKIVSSFQKPAQVNIFLVQTSHDCHKLGSGYGAH